MADTAGIIEIGSLPIDLSFSTRVVSAKGITFTFSLTGSIIYSTFYSSSIILLFCYSSSSPFSSLFAGCSSFSS